MLLKLKSFLFLLFLVQIANLFAIEPAPREISMEDKYAELAKDGVIQLSDTASAPEKYAAEKAASELALRYGYTYKIVSEGTAADKNQIIISVDGTDLPPEGFEITTESDRGNTRIVVRGADERGAVYGTYALLELLSIKDGAVNVPVLKMRDWPSIKNRIPQHAYVSWNTVCKPAGIKYSAWLDSYLDWLLRCRLNYVALWMHPENFNKDIDIKYDKAFFDEIHRRGLKTFVIFNYLFNFEKQGRCITNSEDGKYILDEIGKVIDYGADNILIMCDDVIDWNRKDNYCHCSKCEHIFGNPADEQIFMMKKITEYVRNKKPGLEIMFCPTVYSPWGMKTKGYQVPDPEIYNSKIASAECLKGLKKFYAFFRKNDIDQLAKYGLDKDFAFWWNGVRPRSYGFYKRFEDKRYSHLSGIFWGFPDLYWGWYGNLYPFYPGIRNQGDTVKEFSLLPFRTDTAILCTGGTGNCVEYNDAIWGYYVWNPEKFDQEKAGKQIICDMFGKDSYEDLMKAYSTYLKGLDYCYTELDHNPESAAYAKEFLTNESDAVQLIEKAKKSLNANNICIPEKVAAFYLDSFIKGFSALKKDVSFLADSDATRFKNTTDFIAFGTAHWAGKSGDVFDSLNPKVVVPTEFEGIKDPDDDDLDDSMGKHDASVKNKNDIEILSCSNVSWSFDIKKKGKYLLTLECSFDKNQNGTIDFKGVEDGRLRSIDASDTQKIQYYTFKVELPEGKLPLAFNSDNKGRILRAWINKLDLKK